MTSILSVFLAEGKALKTFLGLVPKPFAEAQERLKITVFSEGPKVSEIRAQQWSLVNRRSTKAQKCEKRAWLSHLLCPERTQLCTGSSVAPLRWDEGEKCSGDEGMVGAWLPEIVFSTLAHSLPSRAAELGDPGRLEHNTDLFLGTAQGWESSGSVF
jgi:hypothetical protein